MSISENDVYTYMVNIPNKSYAELDKIFCNKEYNTEGEKPVSFDGIRCLNYRLVGISGMQNTPPNAKIYLKVGSVDLDAVAETREYLVPGIENPDICNSKQVEELKKKGLLDPKTTIYFKGAYTVFPQKWSAENIAKDMIDTNKLEIYKYATRGILIKILQLLQKMGYKTLVVDPEPGYHPGTATMNNKEKLDGLIEIYEKMGLKKINCSLRTGAFMYVVGFGESVQGLRRDNLGENNLNKDTVIMIGDIDEMCNKFNFATGTLGKFLGIASDEAKIINQFSNVSINYINDYNMLPTTTSDFNGDVFKKPKPVAVSGGSGDIKQKFLKYVNKNEKLIENLFK